MKKFYQNLINFLNGSTFKFCLTLLIGLIVLYWVAPPHYATNDDMNLVFLANGGLSYPTSQLVYTNFIFGSVLKHLFAFIPTINWFTVITMATLLISLGLFLSIYIGHVHIALLLTFASLTYFIVVAKYNYTTMAIAIALFSSSVILKHIVSPKIKWNHLIAAIITLIISSFIRIDSFGYALVLTSPFYLFVFYQLIKNKYYKRIALGILTFALIGGSYAVDQYTYTNPIYSEYKQYEDILHTINDYEYIEDYSTKYANEAEFYVNQGISVNTFDLLRHYTYADESVFSFNRLNNIAVHIEETAFQLHDLPTKLSMYFSNTQHLIWLALTIITTALLVVKCDQKEFRLLALASIAIAVITSLYFIHSNRFPDRVGIAIPLLLSCFYLRFIPKSYLLFDPHSFILMFYLIYSVSIYPSLSKPSSSWITDLNTINQDKEHIYIYDGFSPLMSQTFDFNFLVMNVPSIDNTYRLGGWLYKLPANEAILVDNGISNGFECLLTNQACRLLSDDNGASKVLTYLQEHYDPNTTVETIDTYSNFNIYQFSVK